MPSKLLFGEYLVEHKLVSVEQIVEALVEQTAALPTTLEIVHKNKLLSSDQLFEILRHQTQQSMDFRSACNELGYWSDEIQGQIDELLSKRRIPLGQVLSQKGVLKTKALVEALDEYLSEIHDESGSEKELSNEADNFVPSFNQIEASTASDLEELLGEEWKKNVVALVDSTESSPTNMESLFQEVHKARGLARFIRATLMEEIFSQLEDLISITKNREQPPDFNQTFLSAVELIWSIRGVVLESKSEEKFWQNETSKHQYLDCRNCLLRLRS